MQVYRGMNIGTAKPSIAERGEVPYLGIDLVDPDEPLDTVGMDSLMAVQLKDRFSEITATKLAATLAFDYPTPRELSPPPTHFQNCKVKFCEVDVDLC